MPEPRSITQAMPVADVQAGLERLVDDVDRNETRIVIEKGGNAAAALVSADDLARLTRLDREREERERRFAVIDRMREAFRGVPLEEIERETARAVAEVRAEMAAEREGGSRRWGLE